MTASRTPELDVVPDVMPDPATPARNDEASLAVAEAVMRRVPRAMLLPVAGFVIGAVATLWMAPSYTTVTTFITESGDRARAGGSAFAGLASQLGVGGA